jgi:putative endonuclease
MHFVYILHLKNNTLYTGCTANIKRRIEEHKKGLVQSTKNKKPTLIHYEVYKLNSDAIRREKYLKSTEGKKMLRKQIKNLLKMLFEK